MTSGLVHEPLQDRPLRADNPTVNIYDVNHVNGDIYEIEADFFEREDDDWVFYAAGAEVFRVSWFDVLGVAKSMPFQTRKSQASDKVPVASSASQRPCRSNWSVAWRPGTGPRRGLRTGRSPRWPG